jgi:Family of unknown function (DUF6527)
MTDIVAMIRRFDDHGDLYHGIMLWCPGCEERNPERRRGGLNMLPVSGDSSKRPTWTWNGNLEAVTLSPSILCQMKLPELNFVCHSYLTDGIWNFLNDCTHDLAGKQVPMMPLPEWVTHD